MRRPKLAQQLQVGDYLRVTGSRYGATWSGDEEGCARVDRVEHLAGTPEIETAFGRMIGGRHVVDAVFEHGLPGPVLLRPGDHWTWPDAPEHRRAHDATHTWWPAPDQGRYFAGATVPDLPGAADPEADRSGTPSAAEPAATTRRPAARRAASFTKPATALAVGDYLRILGCHASQDRWDIDEGYSRVAWVARVDPAVAARVFCDPAWHAGPVTGAAVAGLPGLLLIPDGDVEVLVEPNRERAVLDRDEAGDDPAPPVLLSGMQPLDPAVQHAQDTALRPEAPPGEQDLYVSMFDENDAERTLHLDGVDGFRAVPLSELPWPGRLFKCAHADRADALRASYPEDTGTEESVWPAVNAELFGTLTAPDFAACPYHRVDWVAIAPACVDALAAGPDVADMCAALRGDPRIPAGQEQWAESVFTDAMSWTDGRANFVNGQHRACALRAAGVAEIPVDGRHVPGRGYRPPVDARTTAAEHVARYWRAAAAARF
ncbi:MAG: hypothetical protein HOV68_30600, partial [Streptomycetaceae bacterium]|nr:hypothetical protein [Streptomycetaceae bacterium]